MDIYYNITNNTSVFSNEINDKFKNNCFFNNENKDNNSLLDMNIEKDDDFLIDPINLILNIKTKKKKK